LFFFSVRVVDPLASFSFLIPLYNRPKREISKKKIARRKNAHHNLVCRIEPMQARQKDV